MFTMTVVEGSGGKLCATTIHTLYVPENHMSRRQNDVVLGHFESSPCLEAVWIVKAATAKEE